MPTSRLLSSINSIFNIVLLTALAVLPFLFLSYTSEFYEIPKFLLLIVVTGVLLILWSLRMVIEGRVSLTRTPLDLPFLLLIVILAVSSFFSTSLPVAVFGNFPRIHSGAASLLIYILFYFVLVSNVKSINLVKQIVYLLIGAGILLSILSLLSYFGQHILDLPYTKFVNFTPTGSSFSTTAFLSLLLPFPLVLLVKGKKSEVQEVEKMVSQISINLLLAIIIVLFGAVIVLTGSLSSWVASGLSLAMILIITPQDRVRKSLPYLGGSVALIIALATFSYLPFLSNSTPLYNVAGNFPREIQLPFTISWKISVSAFRDAPFWGSGPGSYLTDFTTYKPIEFNDTSFWNVRFDNSFNEYLNFLATLGGPGLVLLLLVTVIAISLSIRALLTDSTVLGIALALSTITLFVLLALHPSTLITWVIGVVILVLFMVVHRSVTETLQIGIAATKAIENQLHLKFDALPEVIMALSVILVAAAFFFTGKYTLADYHHRLALDAVATNQGIEVYNQLVISEGLNPYIDVYRTDLAQTNFALANALAVSKGPTEASPSGSLTDQDRQTIQTLLSQAISEGRIAVTLSPNNPTNWEILGSIYRQISGVADNALSFSLDAYGRAIQKDPLNPQLRLIIGGIYYSVKANDLAIRFFTDAINLKPDFTNGYYNLAVALKDANNLDAAIAAAEKTVSLLQPSSPDYNTASNFLAELKKSKASQANNTQQTPPAAQTNSALENKNLPKVVNLPQPDKIATPEAVKKPTPTPKP